MRKTFGMSDDNRCYRGKLSRERGKGGLGLGGCEVKERSSELIKS